MARTERGKPSSADEYSSADEEDGDPSEIAEVERVSLGQFADLTGVTYQTALRYIKLKYIEAHRYGGRWQITRKELERYQKEGNRRA